MSWKVFWFSVGETCQEDKSGWKIIFTRHSCCGRTDKGCMAGVKLVTLHFQLLQIDVMPS